MQDARTTPAASRSPVPFRTPAPVPAPVAPRTPAATSSSRAPEKPKFGRLARVCSDEIEDFEPPAVLTSSPSKTGKRDQAERPPTPCAQSPPRPAKRQVRHDSVYPGLFLIVYCRGLATAARPKAKALVKAPRIR